jgi:hypothetical protein
MKRINNFSLSIVVLIIMIYCLGCKSTSVVLNPIPKSATWDNSVKEKIYDQCLTVLHLQGFEIEPFQTNKQSGLIVTNKVKFNPIKDFDLIAAEYYLNLLVFETADGKPSINVNINGIRWYEVDKSAWGYKKENVQNSVNNKISDDLTRFFQQLEKNIGKPLKISTTTLSWD